MHSPVNCHYCGSSTMEITRFKYPFCDTECLVNWVLENTEKAADILKPEFTAKELLAMVDHQEVES